MKLDTSQKSKYNGFLTQKNNYVWAGAMCLAWEQIKNSILKEPIRLHTKDQKALQMVQNYNNSNFLKKDLSPECYYVKSGFGQQTISTINKEASQKFKKMTLPKVQEKLKNTDLISYAYIFKRFDFLSQFEKRYGLKFDFNGSRVQSFYAKQISQKKNVFYYTYEDDNNFLIGIKGKHQHDSIFFLKSQENLQIDQVIQTVIHKEEKGAKRYLTEIDEFQMPLIKIEVTRNVKQLEGLYFENQSCKDCYLAKAIEGLKFQVNEKGAVMENFALIVRKKAKKEVKQVKKFLLNKPFWIVMKQKGKNPYLCIKIVNPIQGPAKKQKLA